MLRHEYITNTISTISDTCFNSLSHPERLIVLSNLILLEASYFLPQELSKDSNNLLSSGKRITYEKIKFQNNIGLDLALKAHHIIDIGNQIHSGEIENE